jgi:hypothetical protein
VPKPLIQTCITVFFSSLSILAFEIALLRLCSIRFSYHYATAIISISMIGFVAGGTIAYWRQRSTFNSHLPDPTAPGTLMLFLGTLGLTMPTIVLISFFISFDQYKLLWDKSQLFYLALLAASLAVPFILYGTMMPLLLAARPVLTDIHLPSHIILPPCTRALHFALRTHEA